MTAIMAMLWRFLIGAFVLVSCLILALFSGQSVAAEAAPLKRASFMPLWSPQAQFAGYYVALDKGFYRRHGIDLRILRAGPGYSPLDALQQGEADFTALWLTTAIRQRAQGVELVNLAQLIQRSSLLLIARHDSGIDTVAAMAGRKVGLWGGDLSLPIEVLLAREGVEVVPVRQSMTVNLFLRGGVDVVSAMLYNEYHTLLNAGVNAEELTVFALAELGFNVPEDGLYMLESRLQDDPALASAFVTASLEGWDYAFAHPEEALDILIKYMREAQVPANRVHQRWMLARMADLMQPQAGAAIGTLRQEDYRATGDMLLQAGMVSAIPPYGRFTGGERAEAKKEEESDRAGSPEK